MKKKLFFVQIMRIVGCLGVFTGHFLGIALSSEMSKSFLSKLRTGFMSRTIFSFFWQGDSNVIIFLVLSGFFITYVQNPNGTKFSLEKLIKKLCYVFFPSAIVILLSIYCHFVIHVLENDSMFRVEEICSDFKKLIVGGGYLLLVSIVVYSRNAAVLSYLLYFYSFMWK